MTVRKSVATDVPTWDLPEVKAAIDDAPPIPAGSLDVCRRVLSDATDDMYEAARQARASRAGESEAA